MATLHELAAGLAGDAPCGENLEYDPAFLELDTLARGKPEQQIGSTVVSAQAPEWARVETGALALFERTLDLRVAALLVRASLNRYGLSEFADGIDLLRRLCGEHWASVHPQLDSDDEHDATLRMNALASLTDRTGLLRELGSAALLVAPGLGSISLRDAELVLGLVEAAPESEPEISRQQLVAHARAHAAAGGANLPRRVIGAITSFQDLLNEKVGSGQAVDLDVVSKRLRPLERFLSETLGESTLGSADDAADGISADAADPGREARHVPVSAGRPSVSGSARSPHDAIGTRQEALAALEQVCVFLERVEPANPAPILIRRAQRLLTMNFLEIIRELAPEGMESINKIGGIVTGEE